MVAYVCLVARGQQFVLTAANIDLIGLGIALGLVSLTIRREQNSHRAKLRQLRVVDAERSIALHEANVRLAELSATDPLTGLFNRRYLDQAIERGAASQEPSHASGVLMIDVDHFKQFNDFAGHAGGDRCLRLIAAALRGSLRSDDDIAARYGGEEFAVILPGADLAEAVAVADRLRQAVILLAIPHPGLGAARIVTVSIGVAEVAAGATITEAIERADRLLYSAKQAGRDRIFS
jgi:diguanylate cyclase (GGDEF)-like protein